jgi:hypothetical protein
MGTNDRKLRAWASWGLERRRGSAPLLYPSFTSTLANLQSTICDLQCLPGCPETSRNRVPVPGPPAPIRYRGLLPGSVRLGRSTRRSPDRVAVLVTRKSHTAFSSAAL